MWTEEGHRVAVLVLRSSVRFAFLSCANRNGTRTTTTAEKRMGYTTKHENSRKGPPERSTSCDEVWREGTGGGGRGAVKQKNMSRAAIGAHPHAHRTKNECPASPALLNGDKDGELLLFPPPLPSARECLAAVVPIRCSAVSNPHALLLINPLACPLTHPSATTHTHTHTPPQQQQKHDQLQHHMKKRPKERKRSSIPSQNTRHRLSDHLPYTESKQKRKSAFTGLRLSPLCLWLLSSAVSVFLLLVIDLSFSLSKHILRRHLLSHYFFPSLPL